MADFPPKPALGSNWQLWGDAVDAFVRARLADSPVTTTPPVVSSGSPMSVAATDYGTFQYLTGTETGAQLNAKLSANDAIFAAAVAANPTKWVVGPEQYVPTHLDLSGKGGMLDARLLQVPGTTGVQGSSAGYAAQPALKWENALGAAQAVTVGSMQIGTNQPTGLIFTQTLSTLTLPTSGTAGKEQGDLARYRQGDVGEVYCQLGFPWAADAIPSPAMTSTFNIWRAEAAEVHGIAMAVTSFSMAGLAGATTIERRKVQGATSGAVAVVNACQLDATGGTTVKLTFPSVSKDFRLNENLVDVDTGAVIGVVGQMSLALFGRLDFFYPTANNPQFRLMDQTKKVRVRVDVKGSGDPEVFLPPADRAPSLMFSGLFYPDIEYKVDNIASRGAIVRSCFMGEVRYEAHGISNHALSSTNAYTESGYGYGCETRGFTYGTRFIGQGSELRHLFTTNGNARTYESDALTHLDYGCGGQRLIISGNATDCFAAAFDNHEGCFGLTYRGCTVRRPMGGGRYLTDGSGFNNRGHGTTYDACEVDGGWVGFREQGAQSQAGIKHTILYRNCRAINWQNRGWLCNGSYDGSTAPAQGVALDGTTQLGVYATVRFENTLARGDGQTTADPYFQCGYELGWGIYDSFNLQTERVGLPVWHKGIAATLLGGGASDPKKGGVHRWTLPRLDYSEVPAAITCNPIRLDGEMDVFTFTGKPRVIQRAAGQPGFVVDARQGATRVQHEGVSSSSLTDTATSKAATVAMLTVTSGTATDVNSAASGGTATVGHSTAVAPTIAAGPDGGSVGTGGTATFDSSYTSTDVAGVARIFTSGTVSGSSGVAAVITFGTPYASKPIVRLDPEGVNAADRNPYVVYQGSGSSWTGFEVHFKSTLTTNQTYLINYSVTGV